MKKTLLPLFLCFASLIAHASNILSESFEFANHDMTIPVGWECPDESWLCGYLDKDHNRTAHTGDWYAFTNANESWMFIQQFISSELKYNFSYWAISDGTYDVEFWAGYEADPSQMSQLLLSATISGGTYEQVSAFIESVSGNYPYFGIHATASEGAYYLTIDDIVVDMVSKYDMEVTPCYFDTILEPGSRITIEYDVQNTGYEPLDVYMTPYSDYFTDVTFTADGSNSSSFHTEPQQTVHCTCSVTLMPSVAPGTTCWIDIMFTVSCDCITRMATLWVHVPNPEEIEEHREEIKLYPNPAQGHVIIEGAGLVTVTNSLGQTVMTRWIDGKETISLPKGVYIIRMENSDGVSTKKLIVE